MPKAIGFLTLVLPIGMASYVGELQMTSYAMISRTTRP